eukprot:TRINITY_DN9919_c0_g1_i1.p1 TRINITY_DN9919_c0_g1~~TRINITY_DN9919_c0_g1_i1.p1  ORF type:complete len:481 (-),score=34.00 TRINITY_DN9919_c0_g1_i1:743-2185(-)
MRFSGSKFIDSRLKWRMQFDIILFFPIAILCVYLLVGRQSQQWESGFNSRQARLLQQNDIVQTQVHNISNAIILQACNGFTNQRLSIVFGVMAGVLSGRSLLLPKLPLNGEQIDGRQNIDGMSSEFALNFRQIYNISKLQQLSQRYKIDIYEQNNYNAENITEVKCYDMSIHDCLNKYEDIGGILNLGCGFPSNLVQPDMMIQNEQLFYDILMALEPIDLYLRVVKDAIKQIFRQYHESEFNLLHLRVEEDWVQHCKVYENIPDGIVRDNCFNNTETVGDILAGMVNNKQTPLLISYNSDVNKTYFNAAMQSIQRVGIKNTVSNTQLQLQKYPREISAMINYYMGLHANQFVGNSVSSFTSLLILERRSIQQKLKLSNIFKQSLNNTIQLQQQQQYRWSSYYNEGNIPMQVFLPFFEMPWILIDECQDFQVFKEEVLPVLIQGIVVAKLDTYLFCRNKSENVSTQILSSMYQKKLADYYL